MNSIVIIHNFTMKVNKKITNMKRILQQALVLLFAFPVAGQHGQSSSDKLAEAGPVNYVQDKVVTDNLSIQESLPINHKDVRRIGMVIKIRPEKIDEYKALHAGANPGVRDLLEKYHMRNFSIFLTRLDDGNYYEFGYYEYWGNDFEKDKAMLDAEPRNKEWLRICDPLQVPLKGEKSWREMESVYKNY